MSYCFDTLAKCWSRLEQQLPQAVREGEECMRFGWLLEELHEANHRLGDAVNKDGRVTAMARKLDGVMSNVKTGNPEGEQHG